MHEGELDRVRRNTTAQENEAIDKKIIDNIESFRKKSPEELSQRISFLEKKWSLERRIEFNSSVIFLATVFLVGFHSMYWLILSGLLAFFMVWHAVQGWFPPLPIIRKLKIRTRKEIDWEKFALKALRGDFGSGLSSKSSAEIFEIVRKN